MNKIKLVAVAALFFLTAASANAQAGGQKSGYISLDQVVYLMPEVGKIDTLLQHYQSDSINTQFASLVQEYNYKDSMLTSKDSAKIPAQVKAQYRQDLQNLAYQVQNWQGISQQAMQAKQNEMLEPVYRRAMAALNQVAKENGYTFVFNQEVLLVAPPGDDLLPLVAKKLGLKLPPKTAATNPGTTPAPKK